MKRRSTQSQKDLLQILKNSKVAMSQDMIQTEMNTSPDRATIYRILNRFCEDGIIHKIIGEDSKQYYALCVGCQAEEHQHNHFHFQCTQCGNVECLENEIKINLPSGYEFEQFNAVVSGRCAGCK